MRSSTTFFVLFTLVCFVNISLIIWGADKQQHNRDVEMMQSIVALTGLGDPAISTEARYTRHYSLSDPMAPFMDHPGGIEHFPSGSMYAPPLKQQ